MTNNEDQATAPSGTTPTLPPLLKQRGAWMLKQYERVRPAVDLAHNIARQAEAVVNTPQLRLGEHLQAARTILLTRMISGLDSISLLCTFGFITEAKIAHRSLIDALVRLTGLCKQPELLDDFLAQEAHERIRLLEDFVQLRKTWPETEGQSPTFEQIQAELDAAQLHLQGLERNANRKLRKINEWKWAEAGTVKEVFWAHYGLRSQSAHHSPSDFSRHLVSNDQGQVYALRYGPETELPSQLILDAAKAVTIGLGAFAEAHGVAIPAALVELDQQLVQMYNEMLKQADTVV